MDCGKSVSTEVDEATIVRAVVVCPECYERNYMSPDSPPAEPMLKCFEFGHLPPNLQPVSSLFWDLACQLCAMVPAGPSRTVSLNTLLEAKNEAVRAALNPGC